MTYNYFQIVVQKSQGEIFDIVPVGNNDKKVETLF